MVNKFNSFSTDLLFTERKRYCSESMNGFDKVKEKMDNISVQKLTLIELFHFMWMMNKIPISSQGPKEGNALISARRRKKCSSLREVQAQALHVHWSRLGKDLELSEVSRWPKRKSGINWQIKLPKCKLHKSIKSWKDAGTSAKESWGDMARTCTSTSVKHLKRWKWITSVRPMTFVFAEFDDLESRQDSASIVLTPRVSETASLFRASAADDLSDYFWIATGSCSTRASAVESDLFATSARAAEGNLRPTPNKETIEAVVERANITRDKELVRL